MCGIAGICSFDGNVQPVAIKRMTDCLRHRGPDDEGFFALDSVSGKANPLTGSESKVEGRRIEEFRGPAGLFLGHRRLSILDLSQAGHQPMSNEDGSLWIVHNGEIYNYLEIRRELEPLGHHFKSQTDTEVILHAYEEWGIGCLNYFNGMWAFVIVDLKGKSLFCSRDRAGVKPFYYLYDGKRFCFASEIKALLELDRFDVEPNDQIIADYLFLGLIDHSNQTFFKNIYQLRPGEYLVFEGNRLIIRSYWDIKTQEIRFSKDSDYAERFCELLQDSVRLRLRSDVAVGTCLSGGLDSSSIACLANRLILDGQCVAPRVIGERQKTFSSCFEDSAYDERKFIELVIHQTGAEKNYIFPQPENLFRDLAELVWHQDEPFGSTSIYAQWSVMRLAKEKGITVLLDGQGGDELLAGYLPSFYFLFSGTLKELALMRFVKDIKGFQKNHGNVLSPLIRGIAIALVPNWERTLFLNFMRANTDWADPGFRKKYLRSLPRARKFENDLNNHLYHIFRSATLPSLLHYEDRNSMAFSLETRLPFLDYRLVEYAFSLPSEQKIVKGITKVVLRNAMEGIIPEEIRNRMDKMGFTTPISTWLKMALRGSIGQILESKDFMARGYFNIPKVKELFTKHCDGKRDLSFTIWRWVNLEMWFRAFIDRKPSSES